MSLRRLLSDQLKDLRTFGPAFFMRYFRRPDKKGLIYLNSKVGELCIRTADSDLAVLRQVFVDGDYDIRKYPQNARLNEKYLDILRREKTPIIIDAGANIGAASLWFTFLFPDALIFAVEPNADNAYICRRNTKDKTNVTVIESAIGSSSGFVGTKAQPGASWAVQTERQESGTPIVTVADILSRAGDRAELLLAKIDIEGFEADLFSENTDWLDDTAAVMIEPHDKMFPGEFRCKTLQSALFHRNFEILISGENLVFVR